MTIIETNVPMPSRERKYPLRTMAVGNSFVIDLAGRMLTTVRSNLYTYATQRGVTLRTQVTADGKQLRVWKKGLRDDGPSTPPRRRKTAPNAPHSPLHALQGATHDGPDERLWP